VEWWEVDRFFDAFGAGDEVRAGGFEVGFEALEFFDVVGGGLLEGGDVRAGLAQLGAEGEEAVQEPGEGGWCHWVMDRT